MKPLMPLEQALERMLSGGQPLTATETVPLQAALGRVLAQDLSSPLDVPGEDNSAMDGYALRADDAPGPLPVSQRIAAGHPGSSAAPGCPAAIRCETGSGPGASSARRA